MKRSFDYLTEEAFTNAIKDSIEEVKTIRQGYANWFEIYPDLALFGARTHLLNYFDSILYLQSHALGKIKEIFEGVGNVDTSEGKNMEQNNLKAEIYRNKGMMLLDCIRPLEEGNKAPYHTLDVLQAKLASLDESMGQAYHVALYTHYSADGKWEAILEKPYDSITDQEWDALDVMYSTLETEEEKQQFNQRIEEKLKEASVPEKPGIFDKIGSLFMGFGVSVIDNVVGGPALLLSSILDKGENGHFTRNVTANLESLEQSAMNHVKDEKWYYGGKVVGDGVSTVIGAVTLVIGVSMMWSGLGVIGTGLAAMGVGTVGGAALAPESFGLSIVGGLVVDFGGAVVAVGGVAVSAAGFVTAAGGGAMAFRSINNLGGIGRSFRTRVVLKAQVRRLEGMRPARSMIRNRVGEALILFLMRKWDKSYWNLRTHRPKTNSYIIFMKEKS